MTLKPFLQDHSIEVMVTLVYAKCDTNQILELWDEMYQQENNISCLCMLRGDFEQRGNIRGLPVQPQEVEDFDFCIDSCELKEISFKGSPFTWWNERAEEY